MATLFNTKISDTYEGLIKTSDNGVIGAVEKNLTDGLGNASTLSIGTSSASFTGTLDLTNATVVGLPSGVDSVNGQTGVVVLTTTNIAEGTNLYFTDARVAANSAVALNTAKVSFDSASSTKLNGIEAGAQVNTVNSVNSLTGAVSLGLLELDDVGADGTNGQVLTTNGSGSFTFTTVASGGAVNSVNGQTGTVVLDTDNINEGTTNLYYTDARVSANSSVAANTAKVGITTAQANEIAANTLKTGITAQQATDITNNNAKISFTSTGTNNYLSKWSSNTLIDSIIFDNGTKVGIGTTSPQQKLDTPNIIIGGSSIAAGYRASATLMDNLGGVSRFYSLGADNSTGGSYQFNSLSADASSGSGPLMTISSSGNVGIGTTSPSYRLHNTGTSRLEGRITLGGNANNFIEADASSVDFKSNGQFYFKKGNDNLLTVLETGNVGIGTTSPAHPLDVQGADVDNATIARFHSNTGARGSFIIRNGSGIDPTAYIGTSGGSEQLSIGTEDTEAIRIDASQNVLIGTSSSSDKLSVVSTVGILGDNTNQGLLKLYCEASSHYVGIKGGVHSGGSSYTLQLPNALPNVANQILESNASGTLSWIATPINTIDSVVSGEPTGSDQVINVVSLTQAEYDAGTPVATTFYIIT